MSDPILYYTSTSPPSRFVLMTARAIGLKLELRNLKLNRGEHQSEEYLKLNPQATVPTLVDGDFVIWDSHAIATYLIQKYAKDDSLYPRDLEIQTKINQRLHFDGSTLFPVISDIFKDSIARRTFEMSDQNKSRIFAVHKLIETFLEKGTYMVGDSLTVADLSVLSLLATNDEFNPIDSKQFPKLRDYLDRLKRLPYYEEVNREGMLNLSLIFERLGKPKL